MPKDGTARYSGVSTASVAAVYTRSRSDDGAQRSAAVNVVVTPLILSKSLSVKMATFMSGHLRNPCRRVLDQVEQQRTIESLLQDEVTERRGERQRDERQPKQSADHEGLP